MILQIVVQILAQGAVLAIIPEAIAPYVNALVAAIGVLIAFKDPSTGMALAERNMAATGNIKGE